MSSGMKKDDCMFEIYRAHKDANGGVAVCQNDSSSLCQCDGRGCVLVWGVMPELIRKKSPGMLNGAKRFQKNITGIGIVPVELIVSYDDPQKLAGRLYRAI